MVQLMAWVIEKRKEECVYARDRVVRRISLRQRKKMLIYLVAFQKISLFPISRYRVRNVISNAAFHDDSVYLRA